MTPAPALVLYHDYTSPGSAVAVARLQRLADEGLSIAFAGMEAVGLDTALPVTLAVLEELDRVREAATVEGVQLHRPRFVPPTAKAHLVAAIAEMLDLGASWRRVVYAAFWSAGVDLDDDAVLHGLAEDAGLPGGAIPADALTREAVAAYRRGLASLRGEGVGGVPTLRAHGTFVSGLLPEADVRVLAAYA